MDIGSQVLSDIVVFKKYSKYIKELGRRENWDELITRNVSMHIEQYPNLAGEIFQNYQMVYGRKVLPSMRSLQFSGKPIFLNPSRGYNCSYLPVDDYFAFAEVMFLLLGGTGVGYSVQKHHIEKLPPIRKPLNRNRRFLIPDSIEGWADAIKVLMKAYFFGRSNPIFDYSGIRKKGEPIVTAGGHAPGPAPLKACIENIRRVLDSKENNTQLTSIEVHDIMCYIADAVLTGGIRRAAMISFFSFNDEDMISCKYGNWWETNPQRARANNSAVILRHKIKKKEFMEFWKKIQDSHSGEPGIFFTNNADVLSNPCGEISLKPFQFCNLCEVNVSDVEDQADFEARVKAAAFIGTLQAGYTDFTYIRDIWRETTEKDALLGIGMTGIASGKVLSLDMEKAAQIAIDENKRVAALIGIKPAARVCTVKPSGTSSLVLGCSSGIHAWHNDYYIRRMTIFKSEPIYNYLMAKFPLLVEDSIYKANEAYIKMPVKAPEGSITRHESALNMLERVKKVYKDWIVSGHVKGDNTNNVSATVSVKDHEWDEVGDWMWKNKDCYNGLSVLPFDTGTYKQTPLEDCTKEQYEQMVKFVSQIDLREVKEAEDNTSQKEEAACGNGGCVIT